MSKAPDTAPSTKPTLQETRYSLRELLQDVAEERLTGVFGSEKLHQRDINRVFHAQQRKTRRAGT